VTLIRGALGEYRGRHEARKGMLDTAVGWLINQYQYYKIMYYYTDYTDAREAKQDGARGSKGRNYHHIIIRYIFLKLMLLDM
jgi:hypothetical protein